MYYNLLKCVAEGITFQNKEAVYLEMGVRTGDSFNVIAPFFKQAYAVEMNSAYLPCVSGNVNLNWFCTTTQSFIKKLETGEIKEKFNMVFIDADHKHENSLADFLGISKYVVDGGLIILHDTYPKNEFEEQQCYCWDTYKTAWYIRQNCKEDFEIVTLPFYHGLSIVRKANKQLLWKD
jgi:predicted O-methyltransferase YrrM